MGILSFPPSFTHMLVRKETLAQEVSWSQHLELSHSDEE